MISRRQFFQGASSVVAIGASGTVERSTVDYALDFGQPICPGCCNVQMIPSRWSFPSQLAWAEHVTAPQQITCPNCKTTMTVTFARNMK